MEPSSSSPSSRTRLVVAAQALDIQHLQDVLRTRDREITDIRAQHQQELSQEVEKSRVLSSKNSRLESQVQLLAMKLHELEDQKEAQFGNEVASMIAVSQSGKERDTLIKQLRDELKSLRSQNSALQQEREVLMEKLVLERSKVSSLESKALALQQAVRQGERNAEGSVTHRSTQTSDATLAEEVLDKVSFVTLDALKQHMDLEQVELQYHEEHAARHAANCNELHARMQERLQYEVARLNQEQEKYQSMMKTFANSKVQSTIYTPNRSAMPPPAAGSPMPPQEQATEGNTSYSYLNSATPIARTQRVESPFFEQQEREMSNLRHRLAELQQQQQQQQQQKTWSGGSGVGSAGTSSVPPFPQRPAATVGGDSSVTHPSDYLYQNLQRPSRDELQQTPSDRTGSSSVLQRMLEKATRN